MGYEIRQLSEGDRADIRAKHERAEPKEWALTDGPFVYGYYDSKEEAEIDMAELEKSDKVSDLLDVWVEEVAQELGLLEKEVRLIIRARV